MLAHVLAIAIGLSSLVLFLTAFSMSEIHRQDDFLWSGIGLFYALVLWFCASRITGSLLLGQIAAVAVVLSFSWQTLKLRKAIANPDEAANTDLFSFTGLISGLFKDSGESVSQPNVSQVLDKETNVEDSTPPMENLEARPTTPVPPSVEIASSTGAETSEVEDSTPPWENLEARPTTPVPPSEEVSSTGAETTDTLTTESEDLIESTTASNPATEIDNKTERQIIIPTVEDNKELGEIEASEPTQLNDSETLEEIISPKEKTEIEEQNQTTSEFNLMSPVEKVDEEKPIDVEFTSSETENKEDKSQSSLEDFLAELENSMNKKSNEDK